MKWLRPTITRKFLSLLLGFFALQLLQLVIGAYSAWHIGQQGSTILIADSRRLETLTLANFARNELVAGAHPGRSHDALRLRMIEHERGLAELEARIARFYGQDSAPMSLMREIRDRWRRELYPLLVSANAAPSSSAQADLRRYDTLSIAQLERLNRIIWNIEEEIRAQVWLFASSQVAVIGLSLLLGIAGFLMARHIVSRPLGRFIDATRAIADGAFDRRVDIDSRDELGDLARNFNRMAVSIGEKTARLHAFNEVALAVTASLSLRKLLDQIALYAIPLSGAKGVCIAFYDNAGQRFTKWVTRGLSENFVKHLSISMGAVAEEAMRRGDYLLSDDLTGAPYPLSPLEREEGVRSLICLPLTSGDRPLGVIYFYHDHHHRFEFEETELLKTFSHLAAHAIENARLHATTVDMAEHDTLTGLYNRRKFEQRLHEEILRARRSHQQVAVLLLDIDHFKSVNDTHGHAAGDAVLKALAAIFLREIRGIDLVARVGGEEFMFVLPETDPDGARLVAERIRRAIAAETIPLEHGAALRVTASFGIACYPQSAESAEALLAGADRAMYAAKEMGRNRTMQYTEMA